MASAFGRGSTMNILTTLESHDTWLRKTHYSQSEESLMVSRVLGELKWLQVYLWQRTKLKACFFGSIWLRYWAWPWSLCVRYNRAVSSVLSQMWKEEGKLKSPASKSRVWKLKAQAFLDRLPRFLLNFWLRRPLSWKVMEEAPPVVVGKGTPIFKQNLSKGESWNLFKRSQELSTYGFSTTPEKMNTHGATKMSDYDHCLWPAKTIAVVVWRSWYRSWYRWGCQGTKNARPCLIRSRKWKYRKADSSTIPQTY